MTFDEVLIFTLKSVFLLIRTHPVELIFISDFFRTRGGTHRESGGSAQTYIRSGERSIEASLGVGTLPGVDTVKFDIPRGRVALFGAR